MKIVLWFNFDSQTCINYSFPPCSQVREVQYNFHYNSRYNFCYSISSSESGPWFRDPGSKMVLRTPLNWLLTEWRRCRQPRRPREGSCTSGGGRRSRRSSSSQSSSSFSSATSRGCASVWVVKRPFRGGITQPRNSLLGGALYTVTLTDMVAQMKQLSIRMQFH